MNKSLSKYCRIRSRIEKERRYEKRSNEMRKEEKRHEEKRKEKRKRGGGKAYLIFQQKQLLQKLCRL